MLNDSIERIRLGSWEFNKIQIKDKDMYSSIIRRTLCPVNLWSSNFAYMWAISQSDRRSLLWKIVDGLLVTFVHSYKNSLYLFCLPFGEADAEQLVGVVKKCLEYCYEWNDCDKNRAVVKMINESQLEFLKGTPEFDKTFSVQTWQGIERHFDVGKLSSLEGKDFSNVRNCVNNFRKNNPDAEFIPCQEEYYDRLMELSDRWRNTSGKKYSNIFDGGYYKELIKNGAELDQNTFVMKSGGRIIGMISGSMLPTGQAWGSVIKFEENHRGLSETLIVEFARKIHSISPETSFLNVGSDLGPGGLRDYKLKFRPVLNMKRYQIYLK